MKALPLTLRIHSVNGTLIRPLHPVLTRCAAIEACNTYCAEQRIPARPLTLTDSSGQWVAEYVVEMAVAS